ncbi:MAG: CHAP domain-containing protein [Clostridiales bacterium]|nr:CHAP domain-containing protein [Clostridiales bacterium]
MMHGKRMKQVKIWLCLLLLLSLASAFEVGGGTLFCLGKAALAATPQEQEAFETAAARLCTPAQEGMASGSYALHPGESAYMPHLAPEIIPFDQQQEAVSPQVSGTFDSSNDQVVTVSRMGLMTAVGEGSAQVVHRAGEGNIISYQIAVSENTPTELAKNMAYIARLEFLQTQRAKLPKYNKYARWYYGKKKEVGWCSVFTIYCANAAGANPIKRKEAEQVQPDATLYLREGQVGHQYDGFMALDRFGGIPRVGYLVIYADLDNAYRTTHIGIVTDVKDQGQGLYIITTVEGNMSNTVKSYVYLYDSTKDNHRVGMEKGLKLQRNMSEVPEADRTDVLPQYALHTDHWAVFGFCETWK